MRSQLHQHPSIFLSLLSTAIAIGLYFIHEYFFLFYPQYLHQLLLFDILLSATVAVFISKFICKLNNRVYTDSLTTLWNRRYFNIRLHEELQRAKRVGTCFGVAFIDVDYFKEVNDNFGHVAGDQVLLNIATTIKLATRDIDIVARWGGDEYAIIFPNVTAEGLHLITERMKNAVSHNDHCYHCSISIGASLIDGTMEMDKILSLVDIKLYEDKKRKDVRVEGYSVMKANFY